MQAKRVEAIIVSRCDLIQGQYVLETACLDFEEYKALPQVVDFAGAICSKTGWSSDRMYACYKSGGPIAHKVR